MSDEWPIHLTKFKKPKFAVPKGAVDTHCHIVGDYRKFPLAPNRAFDPHIATQEEYLGLMETLGLDHTVIVSPSFYGFDNSCTLDAMAAFGRQKARGICVVEPDVGNNRLRELDAAGFRGIRFITFASGGNPIEALPGLAAKIAPLGWHVQAYVANAMFADLDKTIRALPCDVVLDHMADIQSDMTEGDPVFQRVLDLLSTGKVWVKLTSYRSSKAGKPYADIAHISKAFLKHAPDRCLWGTDWPHPRIKDMPEDGALLDLVADWTADEALRKKLLVDNPKRLYGF